ncbi:type VI secretion system protein ImpA [Paraburkholderia unamae]|uniref:type VI secretion system protein TssA n=1 Tax=Paraburkholderia unamae TaxID=219649 RepID=UPI000DC23D82|nr:type VI secretion system protein TssA [Paraburkholderia unamae]RAR57602.1 type VI secretion system protein ImpA [Paraburkholderia unamae]
MATLDAGALLAEMSPELPCGEDVEYDPEFLELERVVSGKPDVQFGDTVVDAVPPDWKQANALALSLLGKSRDLRVAGYLARALLNRDGYVAFAEALALIGGMLDQHWDHVYPRLDADDDNDPTARINALTALVDQTGTLADLRDAPLALSRAHGTVTLRDLEYVCGTVTPPSGVSVPSLASIEAAIADAGENAREVHAALESALQSTTRIETLVTERVGAARSIDLDALVRPLRQAAAFLGERVAHAGVPPDGEGAAADGAAVSPAAMAAAPVPAAPPGEISSREDVVRAIDKICKYYERNEPSSPLPLLLLRARRLVDKSFMEILEDLAPDGLAQARTIGGTESE